MKKYRKILLLILVLIIGASVFFTFFKKEEVVDKIKINDLEFSVEIVSNVQERMKGLSGRSGLCENCGMLFIFDKVDQYGFWMKDMNFDIDILWIKNGEIAYIEKGVSHETPEVVYNPNVESAMVLELDSRTVEEFRIEVGDKIEF